MPHERIRAAAGGDEETGLSYFGARYYDAGVGIWYGVDPLAGKRPYIGGYVYCSNSPIIRIDPDGRFDTEQAASIYNSKYCNGAGEVLYAKDKNEWFVSKQVEHKGNEAGVTLQRIFNYEQEAGDPIYGTASSQAMEQPTAKHVGRGIDGKYIAPFGAHTPLAFLTWLAKLFRGQSAFEQDVSASKKISPTKEALPSAEPIEIKPVDITITPKRKDVITHYYMINDLQDTISIASGDGVFNGERYAPGDTIGLETFVNGKRSTKKYPSR